MDERTTLTHKFSIVKDDVEKNNLSGLSDYHERILAEISKYEQRWYVKRNERRQGYVKTARDAVNEATSALELRGALEKCKLPLLSPLRRWLKKAYQQKSIHELTLYDTILDQAVQIKSGQGNGSVEVEIGDEEVLPPSNEDVDVRRLRVRIEELEALQADRTDTSGQTAELKTLQEAVGELERQVQEERDVRESAEERASEAQALLDNVRCEFQAKELEQSQPHQEGLSQKNDEIEKLQADLARQEEALTAEKNKAESTAKELEAMGVEKESLSHELETVRMQNEGLTTELDKTKSSYQKAESSVNELREINAEQKGKIDEQSELIRKQHARMKEQVANIDSLVGKIKQSREVIESLKEAVEQERKITERKFEVLFKMYTKLRDLFWKALGINSKTLDTATAEHDQKAQGEKKTHSKRPKVLAAVGGVLKKGFGRKKSTINKAELPPAEDERDTTRSKRQAKKAGKKIRDGLRTAVLDPNSEEARLLHLQDPKTGESLQGLEAEYCNAKRNLDVRHDAAHSLLDTSDTQSSDLSSFDEVMDDLLPQGEALTASVTKLPIADEVSGGSRGERQEGRVLSGSDDPSRNAPPPPPVGFEASKRTGSTGNVYSSPKLVKAKPKPAVQEVSLQDQIRNRKKELSKGHEGKSYEQIVADKLKAQSELPPMMSNHATLFDQFIVATNAATRHIRARRGQMGYGSDEESEKSYSGDEGYSSN